MIDNLPHSTEVSFLDYSCSFMIGLNTDIIYLTSSLKSLLIALISLMVIKVDSFDLFWMIHTAPLALIKAFILTSK
jgi:hypothetical protein